MADRLTTNTDRLDACQRVGRNAAAAERCGAQLLVNYRGLLNGLGVKSSKCNGGMLVSWERPMLALG